jgi:hypothetical protein
MHARTRTHAHTHTQAHARARAHTHTHTQHTHGSGLLFFCCLSYRRRYILSKFAPDRHNFYTAQI